MNEVLTPEKPFDEVAPELPVEPKEGSEDEGED